MQALTIVSLAVIYYTQMQNEGCDSLMNNAVTSMPGNLQPMAAAPLAVLDLEKQKLEIAFKSISFHSTEVV